MTVETFFANFGHLADAPNGVQKLRELILQLAVQGKLVPQDANDEPASVLLERITAEKTRLIKEGKVKPPKRLPTIMADEVAFQLPERWTWVRLGNLGEAQTGTTPPKKNKENLGNYIPFVGPGDIKNYVIDYSGEGLSEQGITKGRLIKKNSVLMVCIGGSIGKHAINDRDISCNQQINTITPYNHDSVKYLFFAMGTQLFQRNVISQASGSATPIINKQKWSSIPIPLPPLEEQKRIVAKVDQLMALCDELEARQQKQQQARVRLNNAVLDALLIASEPDEFADHWQRISTNFDLLYDHPETIAKLRAAIKKLGVEGKLTGLDDGACQRLTIDQFCETVDGDRGPNYPKKHDYKTEGHCLFLSTKNVRPTGFDFSEQVFIAKEKHEQLRKGALSRGDVIITTRGTLGNVAVYDEIVPFDVVRINSGMLILRANPTIAWNHFLSLFIQSPLFIDQLEVARTGSAQPQIPARILKTFEVPLPSIEEQKRIVAKVDQLMTLCDVLEAKLNQTQQLGGKLMEATVRQLLVA